MGQNPYLKNVETIESPSRQLNFGGTCYERIVKYRNMQGWIQAWSASGSWFELDFGYWITENDSDTVLVSWDVEKGLPQKRRIQVNRFLRSHALLVRGKKVFLISTSISEFLKGGMNRRSTGAYTNITPPFIGLRGHCVILLVILYQDWKTFQSFSATRKWYS